MIRGLVSVNGGMPPLWATHAPVRISKPSCSPVRCLSQLTTVGTNLTIAIEEVIPKVSHHAFVTIFQETLLGSFTGTSKVGFESTSSCISSGDGVTMIGPHYFLKLV